MRPLLTADRRDQAAVWKSADDDYVAIDYSNGCKIAHSCKIGIAVLRCRSRIADDKCSVQPSIMAGGDRRVCGASARSLGQKWCERPQPSLSGAGSWQNG